MFADLILGFLAGVVVSVLATPVGVSGAVLLLPVQLSVLGVPAAAIAGTNLLYNVVAVPGALMGYRRSPARWRPLAGLLLTGALPGVAAGAALRVLVEPSGTVSRVLVAMLLIGMAGWLLWRVLGPARSSGGSGPDSAAPTGSPVTARVVLLGAVAGFVGGIYGIGGGSLIAPVLVLAGLSVATVAPAALASTLATSVVGAAVFALLSLTGHPEVAPHWWLGLACGLGGLLGGYLGARLQPLIPQRWLLLGLAAVMLLVSLTYLGSALLA